MIRSGPHHRWRDLTLPGQFLLAGAVVMVCAMVLVGSWMSRRIEDAVVQNATTSAALLMDSFISPLAQELADTDTLSPPARQALAEIFDGTQLGERVVAYKIWIGGGRIVHASDPALIGQVFAPSDDLQQAWRGRVSSSFEDLTDLENEGEAELGVPLLEVYSPVRQVWSGEVIAVAEFYENAEQLAADVADARRTGWLIVGGTFMASGLLLFGIVEAGGRTIRQQQQALSVQLDETRRVSDQNAALRQTVVAASSRATAETERTIRRIGSDLHDGPAQYLSLASLRLDSALGHQAQPGKDAVLIRESLAKALDELRTISRGLALPDLDNLDTAALIDRAVADHMRQTDLAVDVCHDPVPAQPLDYAQKLCLFRFLQEALSNVSRHAMTGCARLTAARSADALTVSVSDEGCGFDSDAPRALRPDGGQGLFGLRDRAESIGGHLDCRSVPGRGTTLTLSLPLPEVST